MKRSYRDIETMLREHFAEEVRLVESALGGAAAETEVAGRRDRAKSKRLQPAGRLAYAAALALVVLSPALMWMSGRRSGALERNVGRAWIDADMPARVENALRAASVHLGPVGNNNP